MIVQSKHKQKGTAMSDFHPGAILFLLMIFAALLVGDMTAQSFRGPEPRRSDIGARFLQVEEKPNGIASFLHASGVVDISRAAGR